MTIFTGVHHQLPTGAKITVEGKWSDVTHKEWQDSFNQGNPAAIIYGVRAIMQPLPLDNEVYYVHDQWGLGHLVHKTEMKEET
jgi:hypothetical protein